MPSTNFLKYIRSSPLVLSIRDSSGATYASLSCVRPPPTLPPLRHRVNLYQTFQVSYHAEITNYPPVLRSSSTTTQTYHVFSWNPTANSSGACTDLVSAGIEGFNSCRWGINRNQNKTKILQICSIGRQRNLRLHEKRACTTWKVLFSDNLRAVEIKWRKISRQGEVRDKNFAAFQSCERCAAVSNHGAWKPYEIKIP